MHYLTYVVIDHTQLPEDYDHDDIASAVEEILTPEYNNLYDWYEIGGRWSTLGKNSYKTIKAFNKRKDKLLPEIYLDYRGATSRKDEYIGLISLMGWSYDHEIYIAIKTKIAQAMMTAINECNPNDLIIICDLHN